MILTDDLKTLVTQVIKEEGYKLYHMELKGKRLHIYLEKKGGATLGDCEKVSKAIALRLAAEAAESRDLMLDVSTPGIERMLYKPRHFRDAIGERLQVKLAGEVIEARLVDANKEKIELETPAGMSRRISYNEILSAQVKRTTEELFKRR
ncbi:hypothetical protein GF359_02220 [candidate division WOR-3 bacterium]|uniref:Ribosome maturation factor RimP n=1 Tax=candidate division WOR-3 bacterium TaxID=2052148 RepID=A0A9D5K9E5_UNCW3|nr:hypothetical protein [candidate division WOR-3 bacterium]MBD3364009.1 hypothetical protein [candidate division WOR-3 bacterium]